MKVANVPSRKVLMPTVESSDEVKCDTMVKDIDPKDKPTDESPSGSDGVVVVPPEQHDGFKAWTVLVVLLYLGILTCTAIAFWFVLPRYLPTSFFQFWHSHWIWEGTASLAKSFGRDVLFVSIIVSVCYLCWWLRGHFEQGEDGKWYAWHASKARRSKTRNPFKAGWYFIQDARDFVSPPVNKTLRSRLGAFWGAVWHLSKKLEEQDKRHARNLNELESNLRVEIRSLKNHVEKLEKKIGELQGAGDSKKKKDSKGNPTQEGGKSFFSRLNPFNWNWFKRANPEQSKT